MSSVKNKILGGTAFLFLLLVLSGGFSIHYLVKARQASQNVLTANYKSLEYGHQMQRALDSFSFGRRYVNNFDAALAQQEANVTEGGEREATVAVRAAFVRFQSGDTAARAALARSIQQTLWLNMQAVRSKSAATQAGAKEALTVLITILAVIFLVGFTFVANFPSVITTPLHKLTDAIKAIGQRQYGYRIHIESKDEFGEMAAAFNEMAERLEYFESSSLNKILFEKSRAEAVINSLRDASIGIDRGNTVLFANNQALGLLGLAPKDVVGLSVAEVAGRNDLFRFLVEESGTAPFKIVVDGRENFFAKEVLDVAQEGGGAKVIVLKNITSYKELDVAKTNFIATVSHELKTPLAASDFSLKLLEDGRVGQLSAEQKELVQNLKADNRRMLRILSELLNMAQVESGKIQLAIQPVNPYEVVEASVSAVAAAAKEKGVALKMQTEERVPTVQADGDKLAWVLTNFLTNAIRYSPAQSNVVVEVKKGAAAVSFAVTDKGQGIDEAYLSRIFERYYQVPGRSDKKGSGIGLAVCKEFIEAMGGAVWVKSELGVGSAFGFDLPLPQS